MAKEGSLKFHCKDVGYNCEWHLEGSSETDMLSIIEEHAARVHDLTHFKEQAVDNVLHAIRSNARAKSESL